MKYFLLYLVVGILQLVHEITSFPEVLYERDDLKNFSKWQVNTRSSHREVFCKNMFLKIFQNSQKNVLAGVPFLIKLQTGNLKLSEAATGDLMLKEVFLKRRTCVSEPAVHRFSTQNRFFGIIHKTHRKRPVLKSLFNKVAVLGSATLSGKTPTQMLSCEICEIFKNNYFEEHLWPPASKLYLKRDSNIGVFLWILWRIYEQLVKDLKHLCGGLSFIKMRARQPEVI